MPTYLHPGVYVEEIPSGSKPIEGVATSVAAFVGKATKGPVGDATLIQSFDDYSNTFGDIASEGDVMGLAVRSFYLNGGKAAFICRLAGEGSKASSMTVNGQDGVKVLKVSASSKGEWGNKVYFRIIKPDQDSLTFSLEIGHHEKGKFVVDEEFQDIGLRADDDNYCLTRVNGKSAYVELSFADAADPKNTTNQYQDATLTGGELDSSATYFNANLSGPMNLSLNINNLGAELITIDGTGLSLQGNQDDDGVKVAAAIQAAVRALSVDVAHKSFECKYNKTPRRFELLAKKDKSASSLEVYGGDLAVLANLLRLSPEQRAVLKGKAFGSATAEDKFSSTTGGLPSFTQPMEIKLNIDNHGEFAIELKASAENKPDEITLVGDKDKDAESIARAIQDAVQAHKPAVPAYSNFTCEYLSNQFVLTSGSGYSRQSSMAKAVAGTLADFLRISTAGTDVTTIPGREIEQGTAKLVPAHELGTLNEGVKLVDGTEIDPTANDYSDFYDNKLRKVRDVSIIVLPGKYMQPDGTGDPAISATLAHCLKMKNRMLIVDPPPDLELDQAATVDKLSLPSSTYTALYYPWVKIANPFYNAEKRPDLAKTINVAPSAFAAGMWARIDGKRGVWKAPAGMEAGLIGAAGLQHIVEDGEQDQLNPLGVNCFRNMPGGGRVIWGTRTLATKADPEWRYVPVRRTAIMIEQSIFEGIQWAVFEPNDHRLWAALRGNIGNFMNGLFRVGAFQGEKASDAYFVRCGLGDTMTQGEIDAGQVIVIVGFAPLKPAEFVIVRIQQKVNQQ